MPKSACALQLNTHDSKQALQTAFKFQPAFVCAPACTRLWSLISGPLAVPSTRVSLPTHACVGGLSGQRAGGVHTSARRHGSQQAAGGQKSGRGCCTTVRECIVLVGFKHNAQHALFGSGRCVLRQHAQQCVGSSNGQQQEAGNAAAVCVCIGDLQCVLASVFVGPHSAALGSGSCCRRVCLIHGAPLHPPSCH